MNKTENYMERNGFKTWYEIHGVNNNETPLFVLHGGPGYPHNFQNNLSVLADNGFPVILYDQLGCGLSDRPSDTSLWTVDFFVEELEALRKHLGYTKINIIGQSWGGSLAEEYVLKYPQNVDKLILHSPLIDSKLWVDEADKLKDKLPDNLGARMRELEQSSETAGEEYAKLSELFNDTFVLRIKPKPQDAIDGENGVGLDVYHTMWGPSEAFATGNLKEWSVIDRLPKIKQKTLLISGKYDEATPKQMEIIINSIPDVRWELFENSSHCANLEEPEKFMEVVGQFLK
jgi:proline iminopeptidase